MGMGGPVPLQPQPMANKPPPQPIPALRQAPAPLAQVANVPAAAKQAPAPVARPAPAAGSSNAAVQVATQDLGAKLAHLGLSREQVEAVLALSREVIEQVVWEVVPDLAETLIKEELRRLTAE